MNYQNISNKIVNWLNHQLESSKQKGFVVGESGGIDSSVVSTLCAMTDKPVIVVSLPIYQPQDHLSRANIHMNWLCDNYENVTQNTVDLTNVFNLFSKDILIPQSELTSANLRSRLRMCALYDFANQYNYLVVGTGNKVEDYGVAFFSKFGDGGVDISPIGDLMKTEVWELGKYLGVDESIINASPSDGLWNDARSDEDQIGATYEELEWAMKYIEGNVNLVYEPLTERQVIVLNIYNNRHLAGLHKMNMPPICKIVR